jgi:hypothetical protein
VMSVVRAAAASFAQGARQRAEDEARALAGMSLRGPPRVPWRTPREARRTPPLRGLGHHIGLRYAST